MPLAGIKVLDLSAYIAGPYGCALLGDMGADVIKVEPPEGDNLRKYPSTLASESRAFLGINRNKRGLCLNLKEAAGHEILLRGAPGRRAGPQLPARRARTPAHRLRHAVGGQPAHGLLRHDRLWRGRPHGAPRRLRPCCNR